MKKQPSSSLDAALKLTSDIFKNIDVSLYQYENFQLIWSIYNRIHIDCSIPYYVNNKRVFKKRKSLKVYIRLRSLLIDIPLFIYSLLSILYIKLTAKKTVAIWTGDFYNAHTKGDFRLGDLYLELEKNNIRYIDFIRDNANGIVHTVKNLLKRRKPSIYYNSLSRVCTLYGQYLPKINLHHENSLHRDILESQIEHISDPRKIKIFRRVFKLLGVEKFLCWEFSDRQADLIFASKLNYIKSIGFMHGAGMQNYMAHEYMSEFVGQYKIGPDVFGTWSSWWKELFASTSKLYKEIDVCGELRKNKIDVVNEDLNHKIHTVLWISEPLIDPEQVIDYMSYLKNNYKLVIKKRPLTNDIFYAKLLDQFDEFKHVEVIEGDIYDAIMSCDIIVGSHSTAVLDAVKLNKPFMLVNTKKWGNYFKVDEMFFIKNIQEIDEKISLINRNYFNKIKEKYFGKDDDSGIDWIINKIKEP